MKILNLSLLPVLMIATVAWLNAQTSKPGDDRYTERLREFENFVQRQMQADKTVGMTIGFIKDDQTWVKAYGYADLENKIPTKPESAYRLASITKPMTAIAVLQLVEQGKINLDDEIQKYVPSFPKKKYPITVRQLLGHIGGVRHYNDDELLKEHKTVGETVALFSQGELIAEPGTRFNYSGPGYALLGAAVEAASGKPFAEYMLENVWRPLGMNDTRLDDPHDLIPNRVRGYQLVKGEIKNSDYVDVSSRFASGGTRSTVIDLLKFARGMIDGKLLSPETYERMWTPMTTSNGRFTTYGMGWWTDSTNGRFRVWHGGYIMETQAALIIYPREHFAIAVLMNFEGAVPYPYAEKLYKAVLGELWQINVYTKLASDRPTLRGMSEAFTYGMQYFEQHGKPLTTDDKELADAFTYFNSIPTLPGGDAAQRVTNGRHPQANQAFVRMASFMASRLSAANSRTFNDYFRRGMIPFFADYIRLYKSDPSVPAGLRFTPKFEEQVNAWDREWARTWNDRTRDLEISVGTDLESAGRLMRESFAGASLYPNFEPAIESLTDSLVVQGETAKALRSATLAAEIYPESAMANLELGMTTILAGDYDKALAAFRKAKEADPAEASPGTFNRFAYYLAEYASPESAVRMLEAAVELYPRDANLYDSIGELALKLGQKEKAIRSYQKALEIDPNYTNAAGAREALKKLGQR